MLSVFHSNLVPVCPLALTLCINADWNFFFFCQFASFYYARKNCYSLFHSNHVFGVYADANSLGSFFVLLSVDDTYSASIDCTAFFSFFVSLHRKNFRLCPVFPLTLTPCRFGSFLALLSAFVSFCGGECFFSLRRLPYRCECCHFSAVCGLCGSFFLMFFARQESNFVLCALNADASLCLASPIMHTVYNVSVPFLVCLRVRACLCVRFPWHLLVLCVRFVFVLFFAYFACFF
jgi:hypothetical protein